MLRGRQTTGRKIAVGSVAAATALGLTLMTTSPGSADEQNPAEDAEALGQLIESDLFDAELLDAASAYSSSPSSTDAVSTPLNVDALGGLNIDLGGGISLPLVSDADGSGLLEIGNAGTLNAFGHAPAYNDALASAGAVGEDGALNLDDINEGNYGNANVDLTALFDQLGLEGITDEIIDELSLELGAVASTASSDGTDTQSEYVVADGILTVSSPAVAKVSEALDEVVAGTGTTLEEALGSEGLLDELAKVGVDVDVLGLAAISVGGAESTISVDTKTALDSIVENLINEELADEAGIVKIDLSTGEIKIDLAKIVGGADATDLNNLDPNTQVLTSETITKITDAVAEALGTVTGKLTTTLKDALNNVAVTIELPAHIEALGGGLAEADGKITVEATLGQLTGVDDTKPTVDTDLVLNLPLGGEVDAGQILNAITDPLITSVLDVLGPTVGEIVNSTADEIAGQLADTVASVIDPLAPVFENLNKVVELTINEQPTLKDPAQESQVKGDNGDGFTVSAVSLELLPGVAPASDVATQAEVSVADINLASSSVRATAEEPEVPGDPDANTNAAASAAASADADDDSNASAEVAAQAAAQADASTDESAAADASAEAAAESAATEDASSETSADATTETNASATVAAEAASNADATTDENAEATAAADADPAAAAAVASNATSSDDASVEAAANADGTEADAAAEADDSNVDTTATADADGAEAEADVDGAEAEADVDGAAAEADVDGAEAEADVDGAEAEADVDGAEAEADVDGAAAQADVDGAEASTDSDQAASANAGTSSDSESSASASSQSNASASSNASAGTSTNASSSSDGGDLPRTGADGALTMAGFAALLIAGGAAVVFGTRRYRASAGTN